MPRPIFRRTIAKPVQVPTKVLPARRVRTLKMAAESKRAVAARTTARKSIVESIGSKSIAAKLASSKKSTELTRRLKNIASKKVLKSRKNSRTANQKVQNAKNILKARAEKRKTSALEGKRQRDEDFRLAASARMKAKLLETNSHRLQLEIQRYQKTITSDKGVSQLDIADISTIKRLINSVKPRSNGPNRTLDLNTKGGVIQQKQSLLTKTSSETVTMKSLGDKESQTALGAKEKGNTVVREQVPIKGNLDAISGSINTNKSLLKPVSAERRAAVNQKNTEAAAEMKKAPNFDSGRKVATNNKNMSTAKKDAADSARSEQSSHAASHNKTEENAKQRMLEADNSKNAAINAKADAVATDVSAAKAKRTTAENTMKTVKERNTEIETAHALAIRNRATTEESHAQNEVRIKGAKDSEETSRNDMNDGTVPHGNNMNDVDAINSQRSSLQREQDTLNSRIEEQRRITETSRPTYSSEFTGKVKRKQELVEKITSTTKEHDAAVRNLEATIAERQRTRDMFSLNNRNIKNNTDTIAGVKTELSNDFKKKQGATDERATHLQREGAFKNVTDKQNASVREKGNTLECLVHTEEIVIKTRPTAETAAPGVESSRAGIRGASMEKAIAQKAYSNRNSGKQDINLVKGQKEGNEGKLANETLYNEAHGKKKSEEQRNADTVKDKADEVVRNRKACVEEMDAINKSRNQKELEIKSLRNTSEGVENIKKVRKEVGDAENVAKQIKQKAGQAEDSMNRAANRRNEADAKRLLELENLKKTKETEDALAAGKKKAEDDKDAAKKKGAEEAEQAVAAASAKKRAAENEMALAKKRQEELDAENAAALKRRKDSEKEAAEVEAKTKAAEKNEGDAAKAMRDSEDVNNLDNFAESDLVKERNKLTEDIKAIEAKLKKAESDAESYYPHGSEKRAKLRADAESIRAKMNEMKARINEVEAALVKKRAEMENLKKIAKEKEALNKEKNDLESELARKNKELNDIDAEINANNKKTPPDADLDAILNARKKALQDRIDQIKQRLKKIKERLDEIDAELNAARLKKEKEDAMRRKRDEEEFLQRLRKKSDDFDLRAKKRTSRMETLLGILGMIIGTIIPIALLTGLNPGGTTTPNDESPENPIVPTESGAEVPTESGATESGATESGPKNQTRDGNVQTCYNNICTIQNLLCVKGSSEYMRGCKDGTKAGTADGKRDGTKDEKEYAERILPISSEEITNKLKVDTSIFSEIEKEAFCQQLENELQASGKNIDQIYALYPECKVSSKYGTGYGPRPLQDPYGDNDYASGEPSNGNGEGQEGGALEQGSSQDYISGYMQSYRDSYMLSYTNAWALSKLNRRTTVPIVLIPPTLTPINIGFSGPSAPMRPIIIKSKRAIDAEKIIRRLDLMMFSNIALPTYGRFDALRASALAVIAEEQRTANLT
jgi:hypothetical protein